MSMEIAHVLQNQPADSRAARQAVRQQQVQRQATQVAANNQTKITNQQLRRYLEELRSVTQVFNRRLSFTYNEELNQVIVKVIDRETDKVIKELPPDELQRVHMRIREAIGILLDETI